MSDAVPASFSATFALTPRPALFGKTPISRQGVSLEPIFGGHVVHALARHDNPGAPAILRDAIRDTSSALRIVSPGQWFVVGDMTLPDAKFQAIAAKLKASIELIDQTHGRVRMRLRGSNAARVLSKGTAVDLSPTSFAVGKSAMTLTGHIAALITRTDEDCFEIIVLRGFAESLWDDLDHMSREFI